MTGSPLNRVPKESGRPYLNAEEKICRAALLSLCLVSRRFHEVAAKELYAVICPTAIQYRVKSRDAESGQYAAPDDWFSRLEALAWANSPLLLNTTFLMLDMTGVLAVSVAIVLPLLKNLEVLLIWAEKPDLEANSLISRLLPRFGHLHSLILQATKHRVSYFLTLPPRTYTQLTMAGTCTVRCPADRHIRFTRLNVELKANSDDAANLLNSIDRGVLRSLTITAHPTVSRTPAISEFMRSLCKTIWPVLRSLTVGVTRLTTSQSSRKRTLCLLCARSHS